MHPSSLELLKTLFTLSQQELHDFLYDFLEENYGQNNITEKDGKYLFANGDLDVLVVAHLDTVHRRQPSMDEIFHDQDKKVLLSPVGIGADDRCGVFMIMNLIFNGYRPHVVFTWDEEVGGLGAQELVRDFSPATLGVNINFAIQYDRRGHGQSVYYSLYNGAFESYINSFGFTTNYGTYTDICEICPDWGFAGVNLSTGYVNEHTNGELVLLDTIKDTLAKSLNILQDQLDNPKFYEYAEVQRVHRPYSQDQGFWPSREHGYGYSNSYPWYDSYDDEDDAYNYSRASYENPEEPCIICGVDTPTYDIVDEPGIATGICVHCYKQFHGKDSVETSESLYKKVLKGLK